MAEGKGQEPTPSKDGGPAPQADKQANPQTPPGADAGKTETPTQPGAAGKVEDLPEWAQDVIKGLRHENADHRTKAKQAEAEARQAEEKRLADSQEWRTLAEQRKAELDKAAPLVEHYAELDKRLKAGLQAEVAKWPEEVKAVAPGEDADVLAWLDWVEKFRPLAAKLSTPTSAPPAPGNGPAPKPQPSTQEEQRARNGFTATVRGMF